MGKTKTSKQTNKQTNKQKNPHKQKTTLLTKSINPQSTKDDYTMCWFIGKSHLKFSIVMWLEIKMCTK